MGSNHLNNFFIFYGAALCGIVMMLILCVWLSSARHNYLWRFTEWFGRNSFTSMVIHNPIKGIVVVIVAQILGVTSTIVEQDYTMAFVAFLITFVTTCVGIVVINYIKSKIKIL